jgi:hypothetical protein
MSTAHPWVVCCAARPPAAASTWTAPCDHVCNLSSACQLRSDSLFLPPVHLLHGEVRSEGIGRPAPALLPRVVPPFAFRSAPRSQPFASGSRHRMVPVPGSAATCEDGTVPGDPASAFRTAVGLRSRPLVPIPDHASVQTSTAHDRVPADLPTGTILEHPRRERKKNIAYLQKTRLFLYYPCL